MGEGEGENPNPNPSPNNPNPNPIPNLDLPGAVGRVLLHGGHGDVVRRDAQLFGEGGLVGSRRGGARGGGGVVRVSRHLEVEGNLVRGRVRVRVRVGARFECRFRLR